MRGKMSIGYHTLANMRVWPSPKYPDKLPRQWASLYIVRLSRSLENPIKRITIACTFKWTSFPVNGPHLANGSENNLIPKRSMACRNRCSFFQFINCVWCDNAWKAGKPSTSKGWVRCVEWGGRRNKTILFSATRLWNGIGYMWAITIYNKKKPCILPFCFVCDQ